MKVFGGKKNKHSGFWIPKSIQDAFSGVPVKGENENFTRLMRLAEIKRSIKNFVQILTGKSIPVQYLTEEAAGFTDGKTVYISGNIDTDLNFDKTVGLALHEASHIVLSSMQELKAIQFEDVAKRLFGTVASVNKTFQNHINNTKNSVFAKEKIDYQYYALELKNLLNWVEDRRVDAYIQKDSPGYVGYYQELYNIFFNVQEIKELICDSATRTPTFQNYMFHVINLISKHSDVNALSGLIDIKALVDLENILRLESMRDSFSVAERIFELILKNIDMTLQKEEKKKNKKKGKNQEGKKGQKGQSQSSNSLSEKNEEKNKDSSNSDENNSDENNSDENNSDESTMENVVESKLTESQAKSKVKKTLDELEKLLNHETEKQKLPEGVSEKVSTLSGMNVRTKIIKMNHPTYGSIETKVIVIPELSKTLIEQNLLPITQSYSYNTQEIEDGIRVGKRLVNKIKIRNESRQLLSPRQKSGKIQQRVLSDLSFDSENVFYKLTSEEFKAMHFHISVDASGSMCGHKWEETIKLITALTYSACKIKNVNVVVDFRSYLSTGVRDSSTTQSYFPFVIKAFDSRKQSFSHFKELINCIRPNGMTPEGMCFQAMLDEYVPGNHVTDSVFINLSDGYPGCTIETSGYQDGLTDFEYSRFGIGHTKEIVKRIKKMNISVVSYFIGGYYSNMTNFKKMYGKDSKSISSENVLDIARSINESLLKK